MIPDFLKPKLKIKEQYECWIWTGNKTVDQYGKFRLDGKEVRAHRYIYEYNFGPLNDAIVRHKCDNSLCCNPFHLEKGTHEDNVRDRVERKRSAIGTDHGRAKLLETDVKAIFQDHQTPTSHLAHKYKVDPKVIYNIRRGLSWKHITGGLLNV